MRTFVIESTGNYVGELLNIPTTVTGKPATLQVGEYANATDKDGSFVAVVTSCPWEEQATPPNGSNKEDCQFYYGRRV